MLLENEGGATELHDLYVNKEGKLKLLESYLLLVGKCQTADDNKLKLMSYGYVLYASC